MQVLLLSKRIETQLIKITNKPKATPAELQPTEKSVKAERNRKTEKLGRLHATELHAEL